MSDVSIFISSFLLAFDNRFKVEFIEPEKHINKPADSAEEFIKPKTKYSVKAISETKAQMILQGIPFL